jgi:hypothetical protein
MPTKIVRYSDVADEYLDIFELKVDKSNQIFEEINHKEASQFYCWMFKKHSFLYKVWTLGSILRVLKDYMLRIIFYITLLLACFAARAVECKISHKRQVVGFEYNLSPEECQTVFYTGGDIVAMKVKYPDAYVVSEKFQRENNISFIFQYGDKKPDIQANLNLKSLASIKDDISFYKYKNTEFSILKGIDGENIFVAKMKYTWLATRMFEGVMVQYQYDREVFSDLKAMDKFALHFLQRVIIKNGENRVAVVKGLNLKDWNRADTYANRLPFWLEGLPFASQQRSKAVDFGPLEELKITKNWFHVAAEINSNDGSFISEMVHDSMQFAAITQGRSFSIAEFQVASDQLAKQVGLHIQESKGIPYMNTLVSEELGWRHH